MSFDPRCFDLAEVFLEERKGAPDYMAQVNRLAQEIQDAIEGYFILNPTPAEVAEDAERERKWKADHDRR